MVVERLSGDQLAALEVEHASTTLRRTLVRRIDLDLPDCSDFLLDAGDGTGMFATRGSGTDTGIDGTRFRSKPDLQRRPHGAGIASLDHDDDSPSPIPSPSRTPLHANGLRRGDFHDGPTPAQHFSTGHSATA